MGSVKKLRNDEKHKREILCKYISEFICVLSNFQFPLFIFWATVSKLFPTALEGEVFSQPRAVSGCVYTCVVGLYQADALNTRYSAGLVVYELQAVLRVGVSWWN